MQNKRYTINFRLRDLEARLEPSKFIRLSRGALVNMETIQQISPLPGGTYPRRAQKQSGNFFKPSAIARFARAITETLRHVHWRIRSFWKDYFPFDWSDVHHVSAFYQPSFMFCHRQNCNQNPSTVY
ncbi:MAG: LytTR family DNA-binding domain-containing protein [Pyrinomonadaceae bacterium]